MRAASAADSEIGLLVSVYQNIGKLVFENKFKKLVTRFGMRPSVFVAMGYDKSALFGGFSEPSVVVSVAATAILNAAYVVVIVNHFVKKCCDYVLNRSCERSGANVDFVCAAELGNPSVTIEGEVSVCFRGALDGDCRSCESAFKKLSVQ